MKKLARSLGPRHLARVLRDGGDLNHPDDPVTFLEVIEAETTSRTANALDVWDYGSGRELGVFVVVETKGLTLHTRALPSHGHDPRSHPNHVYVHNADTTLGLDLAVLVENPEELVAAAACASVADANATLTNLRDGEPITAVAERLAARARELSSEAHDLADTLDRLRTGRTNATDDEVAKTLARLGLDPRLLDIHPEHMPEILRRAVHDLERALTNDATEA